MSDRILSTAKAIRLAQAKINVAQHGDGWCVTAPARGLRGYLDGERATRAAVTTMSYQQAVSVCRHERIAEAVSVATGDPAFAAWVFGEAAFSEENWRGHTPPDWRGEVRRFVAWWREEERREPA